MWWTCGGRTKIITVVNMLLILKLFPVFWQIYLEIKGTPEENRDAKIAEYNKASTKFKNDGNTTDLGSF